MRPTTLEWRFLVDCGFAVGPMTEDIGIEPFLDPQPLPPELPAVDQFELTLLPGSFRPWIADIVERIQCPPEFAAIPAMVAVGSIVGRQVGIRPKRCDDWIVVPNVWGAIIGRPGQLKSPPLAAALKPLGRLAGSEYTPLGDIISIKRKTYQPKNS